MLASLPSGGASDSVPCLARSCLAFGLSLLTPLAVWESLASLASLAPNKKIIHYLLCHVKGFRPFFCTIFAYTRTIFEDSTQTIHRVVHSVHTVHNRCTRFYVRVRNEWVGTPLEYLPIFFSNPENLPVSS